LLREKNERLEKTNCFKTRTNVSAKAKGEVTLYFQDPQELLSIFSDLEDENLALIQECREAESNLEKIRTIVREVSEDLNLKFLHGSGCAQSLC